MAATTTLSTGRDSRVGRDNWSVVGLRFGRRAKDLVTDPLFSKSTLHYEYAKWGGYKRLAVQHRNSLPSYQHFAQTRRRSLQLSAKHPGQMGVTKG